MPLLEKQCSKCKQVLPVAMVSKDRRRKDGLRSDCKSCQAIALAKYYVNGGKEKKQSYCRANPFMKITMNLVSDAKRRAKDKNVPFDIDLDYVRSIAGENAELASRCPVFGTPLEWSCQRGNGHNHLPNSPSLDRIVPERGYVKDNLWIISHRANTIKNDASHDELKLLTKAVGEAIVNSLEF